MFLLFNPLILFRWIIFRIYLLVGGRDRISSHSKLIQLLIHTLVFLLQHLNSQIKFFILFLDFLIFLPQFNEYFFLPEPASLSRHSVSNFLDKFFLFGGVKMGNVHFFEFLIDVLVIVKIILFVSSTFLLFNFLFLP